MSLPNYSSDNSFLQNDYSPDTTIADAFDEKTVQITEMQAEIDTLKSQVAQLITLFSLLNSPNPTT
jgi:hypothetical protein